MGDGPGLDEQVTTYSTVYTGGVNVAFQLRRLNHQRRIRRMRSCVITAAECARDMLTAEPGMRFTTCLVTLTYRPGVRWQACHIRDYIKAVRQRAQRCGVHLRYQWVIELQKRGAPHYHVVWWMPKSFFLRSPNRSGEWKHGFSDVKRARSGVGYLVKYATKGSTAVYDLPKNARLFGCGGGTSAERLAIHRAGIPQWLRSCITAESRARRVPYAGWCDSVTGEVFRTPFLVTWRKDDFGVVIVSVTHLGVLHGITSEDRGRDSAESHDPWEGWGGIIHREIADRDYARWSLRLSAELAAG